MRGFFARAVAFFRLDEPEQTRRFFVFLTLAALGCAVGAAGCGSLRAAGNQRLEDLSAGMTSVYSDPVFGQIFGRSLLTSLIYFTICVLSGFFAFGMAVAGAALFVRGLSYGLISGLMCCEKGINGFIYHLAAVIPGAAISGVVFAFLASVSCISSAACFNVFANRGRKKEYDPRLLTGYIICAAALVICSLTDAALGAAFGGII